MTGVDCTAGLLTQAQNLLAGMGPAQFKTVLADISELGSWLEGADVVIGRAVLHHIPMVEFLVGKLRTETPARHPSRLH